MRAHVCLWFFLGSTFPSRHGLLSPPGCPRTHGLNQHKHTCATPSLTSNFPFNMVRMYAAPREWREINARPPPVPSLSFSLTHSLSLLSLFSFSLVFSLSLSLSLLLFLSFLDSSPSLNLSVSNFCRFIFPPPQTLSLTLHSRLSLSSPPLFFPVLIPSLSRAADQEETK